MNTHLPYSPENLRRVSAEGWLRLQGESGFRALGNVRLVQMELGVDVKRVLRATRHGLVTAARERTVAATPEWVLSLNEHHAESLMIAMLGERGEDVLQEEILGHAVTLQNVVPGRTYDLGSTGLANVVVTRDGLELDATLDVLVDAGLGHLTVLETGVVATGDDLVVDFDRTEARWITLAALQVPQRDGTLKLVEWDLLSEQPRAVHVIPCAVRIDSHGDLSLEEFCTNGVRIVATGQVVSKHRAAPALPDYLITEAGEYLVTEAGEYLDVTN